MEADRAEVNLDSGPDPQASAELVERPKQPRKRFVGRKAATEQQIKSENAVEDSGALQGKIKIISYKERVIY